MPKKRRRPDRTATYYAAIPWSGARDRVIWSTIRPTALEAAEVMARVCPGVEGAPPPAQVVEITVSWDVEPNGEFPV